MMTDFFTGGTDEFPPIASTGTSIGLRNDRVDIRVGDHVNAAPDSPQRPCWCTVIGILNGFRTTVLMVVDDDPIRHLAYANSELNWTRSEDHVSVWTVA